jgi:hypothetical protein
MIQPEQVLRFTARGDVSAQSCDSGARLLDSELRRRVARQARPVRAPGGRLTPSLSSLIEALALASSLLHCAPPARMARSMTIISHKTRQIWSGSSTLDVVGG